VAVSGGKVGDRGPITLRLDDDLLRQGLVRDDELFVTGRIKDLIIIRGQNHYPQDIEHTAQASHPSLRPGCGAAFSVEAGGEERLVVVHEVVQRAPEGLRWPEVIAAIRAAVAANHELQAYGVVLLETGSIHKTSSGKIQRRACRQAFVDGTLRVVEQDVLPLAPSAEEESLPDRDRLLALPADQRQPILAEAMRGTLARLLKVDPSSVALDAPVVELGIDSLAIVELRHRVESDLGVEIPFELLIEGATLEGLAAHVVDRACTGGQ
jgi:acyl carrier protein